MMRLLSRVKNKFLKLEKELQQIKFNQGLILSQMSHNAPSLNQAEFKVFSQSGEDGAIQYILKKLNAPYEKYFVEFGVENFTESNCRFLLMKDNWSGLVLDSSAKNIRYIEKDELSWRHPIKARQAFITRENIETILTDADTPKKLGLLSIDIDGNDYWVFEAIKNFEADILILEYNALFGIQSQVTIPYEINFSRTKKHYSNLYWGASLNALNSLANDKGYFLVGCNSNGNNAFFVHSRHRNQIAAKTVEEAYRPALFRESRNEKNELTLLDAVESKKLIGHLKVWDLEKNQLVRIAEL